MDRRGDGTAPPDHERSSERARRGDEASSDLLDLSAVRAAEIADLSRRALTAEVKLLAYVDALEDEVRRLRHRLGGDGRRGPTDGTA